IFATGDMFALISGSALFLKADESNRARFDEAGSTRYGAMPYYRVPSAVLADPGALMEWAATATAVARATPKKKRG
ncbi:MAG: TfoX/Sxy family protein, partial [Chloroflexota bacterium]